jgi:hypothetical protein
MSERIVGGTTVGETVLGGARRLVALGEAIARLEESQAQLVEFRIERQDGDPLRSEPTVPVTRGKLLDLLRAEQQDVGERLARILGTLYGKG